MDDYTNTKSISEDGYKIIIMMFYIPPPLKIVIRIILQFLITDGDFMNIKIVYSKTKTFNGFKTYSLNLYSDMSKQSSEVKLVPLPKIEFNFMGKRVGGWTSQRLFSWTAGKADIVHSTTQWDLTQHTNVVTIHDLFALFERKLFNLNGMALRHYLKTLKRVEKKAKLIIVEGPHIEDQVRRFITNIPIAIIPTKVFVSPGNENPYPNDGKLHLFTMGEISPSRPRKKIYELYEWIRNIEGVDLYHAGIIEDKKYLNYAKNIHQLGQISQQAKFNYLQFADKYVFKTIGEGQGFPVMEAMKLNTQVVVNDIPEHRFFLGDKPYYYHDKEEFLDMIWKPKKPGLVEQISQYDNWIEKYLKAYVEILN